jgi:hypothetical protein
MLSIGKMVEDSLGMSSPTRRRRKTAGRGRRSRRTYSPVSRPRRRTSRKTSRKRSTRRY